MTPGLREERIESSRMCSHSCLPLLYESVDCFAEGARGFDQGGRPMICQIVLNRPAGASEPLQDIDVTVKRIDEFPANTSDRIREIQ